jgi:succinate dehydrogenase / fumarate reductase, cytochrome b subunit
MNSLSRLVKSSLGTKYLMALTGFVLTGYVLAHMAGNLFIFFGPDALNSYAHALKSNPELLWPARIVLLLAFLLHISIGIRLSLANSSARPIRYSYEDTVQASWASRHMLLTGLVLLAFVIYHLAHFTFGVVVPAHEQHNPHDSATPSVFETDRNYLELAEVRHGGRFEANPYLKLSEVRDREARHDVYSMVVSGFHNPWIAVSYLVSMVFLWLHLWHGGSSWFQSLGLNHTKYNTLIRGFGPAIATLLLVGNCSIVLCVWLGLLK